MIEINNKDDILKLISSKKAVLLYFAAQNCSVCDVLKPKIEQTCNENFPKIEQIYINSNKNLELSSHFNIFSSPTILVIFETKEFKRYNRNISILAFKTDIKRLYDMVFEL